MAVEIIEADLHQAHHQRAVVDLINAYAGDIMGGGKALPEQVQHDLVPGLQAHPTTLVLLAYDGAEAVGIAVCFQGFSTFKAKPLVNIHDLAVAPTHRSLGIGRKLLDAVEHKARERGCCAVTLEVLEKNDRARRLYAAAGFAPPGYNPEQGGGTLFLSKLLS